jgi:amino acid transporter
MRSKPLGTFTGVFTPSILTILGVILFLRTGYVVGRTGLFWTLLIVALASAIALLTAISLAAIATNMRVRGGGDYYLISRTLGVEYGAALGIVLFVAQSLSIAFYCFGFGEALTSVLGHHPYINPRALAASLMAILFLFAWLGTDWASRLQIAIMTVLAAALLSFFAGGLGTWSGEQLQSNWRAPADPLPFWAAFALFFPAVTGFTQGVSMSGDLANPGRSLPVGTLWAVGLSSVIYFAAAVVFAAALPAATLADDYEAMWRVALSGALITAGVLAATASSAMASYMGAPRILQALAADRVFPLLGYFAQGTRGDNNPRRGVLLSTAIALTTIALADLNTIAPLVAMFFLMSYGLLNYATFFEARAASPQFRPQFRYFHQRLSLAGAAGCLVAMLAIEPTYAVIAVAILFAIHQFVQRTVGPSQWADSQRSYNFQRVRELLIEMSEGEAHPRDWRPQILVFSKDRERRKQVICFGSWIEGNSGITSVVSILTGGEDNKDIVRQEISEDIAELGVDAFVLVVRGRSFDDTLEALLQSYGLGPIRANIILLNWFEERPAAGRERAFGHHMRESLRLGCNIVALSASDEAFSHIAETPPHHRRIDVWWAGTATSRLSLMLAYLMTRTEAWRDSRIVIHAQGARDRSDRTLRRLSEFLKEVRIDAEINVLPQPLDAGVLIENSRDATATFIPMRLDGDRPTDFLDEPLEALQRYPIVVALVLAGEDIELDSGPDD